jgi:hypothetical protein
MVLRVRWVWLLEAESPTKSSKPRQEAKPEAKKDGRLLNGAAD